jgi:hypothetical protein
MNEDDWNRISRRRLLKAMTIGALAVKQDARAAVHRNYADSCTRKRASLSAAVPPSQDELTRLGDSVAIRGECEGIPIYGFGYTYIYGVSPDFVVRSRLQAGNHAAIVKLKPKKSWEISDNMLGATPPREPRTARTDQQPFLGISLIDNDPDTYWSCRGQCRPDVETAWVRIDLAVETIVKAVVIVPRADNLGMPSNIVIR